LPACAAPAPAGPLARRGVTRAGEAQELTARTHFRGQVRKRIVPFLLHTPAAGAGAGAGATVADAAAMGAAAPLAAAMTHAGAAPAPGDAVTAAPAAGGAAAPAALGKVVSCRGGVGLALVRLREVLPVAAPRRAAPRRARRGSAPPRARRRARAARPGLGGARVGADARGRRQACGAGSSLAEVQAGEFAGALVLPPWWDAVVADAAAKGGGAGGEA
jgi:hypothetical protein